MKSRLRFVLIFGILGLLTSLVAIGPAFAATGKVTLKGGALDANSVAEGKFFSDKDGFNIVTATTEDSDLSPSRTGKARYTAVGADISAFTLKLVAAPSIPILEGEKDKTDSFKGSDATGVTPVDTFTLVDSGRDADGDGDVQDDDVSVTLNGASLTSTTDYTVTLDSTLTFIVSVQLAGTTVTNLQATDDVVITYEMSEFDQAEPENTPLRNSGSVEFGADFSNLTSATGVSGVNKTDGVVNSGLPASVAVLVTFVYDVKETMTEQMGFVTPTLGSRGLTRKLDGVETDFDSNKFEAKIALFTGSDFDKIKSADEANFAGVYNEASNTPELQMTDTTKNFVTLGVTIGFLLTNTTDDPDSSCRVTGIATVGTGTPNDTLQCALAGGTNNAWALGDAYTVDDPQLNGLEAQLDLVDTSGVLGNRAVKAATTDLGLAATVDGTTFVNRSVPVSDGDVLTVSYTDADPVGTRSVIADIDLKAPTIRQVGPLDKAFTNSLSQTLVLEVEDEASVGGKRSGIATTDVNDILVSTKGLAAQSNVVVPLFLGGESFRVSLSKQFAADEEGPVTWHIVTKDKVGNTPAATVAGTNGTKFNFNLDTAPATPAAAGSIRPVLTGGKVDTRFAVALTGSATSIGAGTLNTTQLDDANAKFVTNGVKVGDKITNTTDSSTATVVSVDSEIRITHGALSGTPENTWAVGEGYKIDNPLVNTITSSGTAVGMVSIFYDLGTGDAPIDPVSVSASDFEVNGVNPTDVIVGAVDTSKSPDEQGLLLILAAELSTTDKPNIEQTGTMLDVAGNTIVTFTGTANDIQAKDGLSPVITLAVTGTAASRPVTNNKVTISITANEDTGTPNVSVYTVGSVTASGNAAGAAVAVGTLKFVTTRSWEVDVTPGAGLYSVYATATDTGGNAGKAGVENVVGSDTDAADAGTQIDLTKAVLFEKDTGIPTPELLPASTSNTSPFISAKFSGEGKEYGLEVCTVGAVPAGANPEVIGVPNVNCSPADVTAGRGHLSADSTKVTASNDVHKTVTLMSASIDGTDVTDQVNTVDDITFLYRATGLSIADHTFIIRVRDASGNEREFTHTVTVTERALFKVNLIPGWNMISFPGTPADSSVAAVIGNTPVTTIYTFAPTTASKWMVAVRERMEDGTFSPFVGNLTNIDPNQAYWVLTETFEAIQVDIPPLQGGADPGSTPSTPPTIEVVEGWNFIPVLDVTGALSAGATLDSAVYFAGSVPKIARIYVFDTQAGTWTLIIAGGAADDLVVGKAYWVFATSAFTLVP